MLRRKRKAGEESWGLGGRKQTYMFNVNILSFSWKLEHRYTEVADILNIFTCLIAHGAYENIGMVSFFNNTAVIMRYIQFNGIAASNF